MLLEGFELTIEDRESQLYDNFEHFRRHKGESIHNYYVRFAKLINDIQNIKMTMSRLQLNYKFVNNMLPEWGRFMIVVKLNRGLRDSNYDQLYAYLKQHEIHAQENKMMLERFSQPTNRVGNVNPGQARPCQARPVKCYNCNGTGHIVRNCTQPKLPQNSKYFKDKMLLMQAQENGVSLDEEQLLFLAGGQDNAFDDDVDEQLVQDLALNVDNVFQADECDAFDSDIDEAPTAQTMFMANLSSTDPVTDEAGPSYDSDILSEVQYHVQYIDAACVHHKEHVMHDSVQLDHVVDSHADYTSDSNMIPYDQYVKDNEVPVVHSDISSVPNNAFMMKYNDMCEPPAQSVSNTSRNTTVKNSLTAELATYKEQVELELHSLKLQLASTTAHNKSMVEEVTFLKKEFKQKENKYLENFLDMKSLKEKIEDRLIKQDQSLKTVHMLCIPKPYYNELNKVVIGYKNPLCLTRAKQTQPALHNGHEILKDNHAPAKVYNTEDTLKIAEITRKKMNAKITDPDCVTRKVKIEHHDYSKENLLATFTPQKQLTPKQIYWSNDLMKLKFEALKEQTKVSRPIKAFTVYPPNTPATLVPKVLPTKSQVKIHIFTLIQLFLDFDKSCKNRITPTGLTEGERGFEQTKECYLKEFIPFFKTLKDNFEGIQKALTKEIKEMKDVLEELEAKVAQFAVDRKYDATRFTKMHVSNTTVEARCLALEAELANLRDKSHHGNHEELINHFFKLKENYLNLQLKYQNLKDSIRNNPPTPNKESPDFDYVFVIGKMQASLQGKDNAIRQLKIQLPTQNDIFKAENDKIKQHYKEFYDSIKITRAKHIEQVTKLTTANVTLKTSVSKDKVKPQVLTREKHTIDVEPIVPRLRNNKDAHLDYLRHLKESVETIRDIVEEAKVKVKQVWKPKQVRQVWKPTGKVLTTISQQWRPTGQILNLGKQCPSTRSTPPKVVSATQNKKRLVQIVLWYLDSGCSKPMTGDRSRLLNFMKKFIGTVRFGNYHFGAIMGYRDYVIGESVISRVYYVEGLGYNLFFVGEFCDFDLEVAFRKHSCYVQDTDSVDLIMGSRGSNFYTISVEDMMKSSPICLLSKASKNKSWLWHRRLNHLNFSTINDLARKDLVRGLPRLKFEKDHLCSACQLGKSKKHTYKTKTENTNLEVLNTLHMDLCGPTVPRTPQQNSVVEKRNRTLVEAARTMLIFSKALVFMWAEAMATVCYIQNRSLIHTRHHKTSYELVHNKKPGLTFFRVFGALCYPTNDSEDLEKLQPTADVGIFFGYAPSGKGIESTTKEPDE
nr:integrase, catalytic region, zinc finger, CCHC-type, peptidase aspartic, catalytic [Tanacetum cinerariifolium]